MQLTTQFVPIENVLIVRLEGELDHHSAARLKIDWQEEMRKKPNKTCGFKFATSTFHG